MDPSAHVTSGRKDIEPIHSVELPGVKMSLLFRHGDVDVLLSDIDADASLSDESLGSGFSWHLVVEGRALFEQGDIGWEVLPARPLRLLGALGHRIVNTGKEPLRLLSIVVGPAPGGESVAAWAKP